MTLWFGNHILSKTTAMLSQAENFILVPIDYSEYSKKAAIYAIHLARKFNAEVKLFHSYYYPTFEIAEITGSSITFNDIKTSVLQNLETGERAKIEAFESQIRDEITREKLNVNIEHIVMPGIPDDELAKITQKYKPLFMVMGIESNENIHRPIFGTTAEAILKKCKVPIFILPADNMPNVNDSIPTISYVTHFDESDFSSLTKLVGIANGMKCGIDCLHITSDPESELEIVRLEGLRSYFKSVYKFDKVSCVSVFNKELHDQLSDMVQKAHINILSFTLPKRSLLSKKLLKPTIARKIFYNLQVPLLVFHR